MQEVEAHEVEPAAAGGSVYRCSTTKWRRDPDEATTRQGPGSWTERLTRSGRLKLLAATEELLSMPGSRHVIQRHIQSLAATPPLRSDPLTAALRWTPPLRSDPLVAS